MNMMCFNLVTAILPLSEKPCYNQLHNDAVYKVYELGVFGNQEEHSKFVAELVKAVVEQSHIPALRPSMRLNEHIIAYKGNNLDVWDGVAFSVEILQHLNPVSIKALKKIMRDTEKKLNSDLDAILENDAKIRFSKKLFKALGVDVQGVGEENFNGMIVSGSGDQPPYIALGSNAQQSEITRVANLLNEAYPKMNSPFSVTSIDGGSTVLALNCQDDSLTCFLNKLTQRDASDPTLLNEAAGVLSYFSPHLETALKKVTRPHGNRSLRGLYL